MAAGGSRRPQRRLAWAVPSATAAAAIALISLGAVLGCDRANHPAEGSAAQELFPLVEGAKWVYEVRSKLGDLRLESIARGVLELPDERGEVFVVDETNLGPSMGFVETAPVGYFADEEGYLSRLTAIDYDDAGALRFVGEEDAAWFLPLDPKAGHRWGQLTDMFDTPEGGGGELGWSGEVMGLADVTVPAGEFKDAVEVRLTYRDAGEPGVEPLMVYHDYYVRGVGLVRSVADDPSGDPNNRVETVLVSFEFPN